MLNNKRWRYNSVERFVELPLERTPLFYPQSPAEAAVAAPAVPLQGGPPSPYFPTQRRGSTEFSTVSEFPALKATPMMASPAASSMAPKPRRYVPRGGPQQQQQSPPSAFPQQIPPQPLFYTRTPVPTPSPFPPRAPIQPRGSLADVYSSNNSAQFAENLSSYADSTVPSGVWLSLLGLQIIAGLVSIFIGVFNYQMCYAERKIPIYLIISGVLLLLNATVRIIAHISSNSSKKGKKRAGRSQQQKSGFGSHLGEYAIEGIILLAMIVNTIFGCVWVFGAWRYVHHETYGSFFRWNYCDYTLFWTAFWSLVLHLVTFGLVILFVIVIQLYGAMKK